MLLSEPQTRPVEAAVPVDRDWLTMFACSLCLMFSIGTLLTYSFGIFVRPLAGEFHWSRTQVFGHPEPFALFSQQQQDLIASLDIDFAHVSRGASAQYADIDGEYDLWYRESGQKAFLLRPDNYVYGSVRTIEELPGLLDELGGALAAHGWHGVGADMVPAVDALQAVRP